MIYLPKSQPAPESLAIEKAKKSGTYNGADVLARLVADFKNKCYICEYPEPPGINTEHFVPHKGDRDLLFDWDNLFFSCGHCNNTKLAKEEYVNILKCTLAEDGVDTKIAYRLSTFPGTKAVLAGIERSEKVVNTISLLVAVYNGTTDLKKLESANIRKRLKNEIEDFEELVSNYLADGDSILSKSDMKKLIVRHLVSDVGGFTAFKRWIIRDNDVLNQEFGAFF